MNSLAVSPGLAGRRAGGRLVLVAGRRAVELDREAGVRGRAGALVAIR
jgi:hypothetical protein